MALRAIDDIPWTLEMRNPNDINKSFNMNVSGNNIVINLATDGNGSLVTTYSQISGCLNFPYVGSCNCSGNCGSRVLESVMFIGISSSEVASPMNQTLLIDTKEDAVNNREDTGFRCLNPIDPGLYLE
jgi:hypothetical protein